LASGTAPPPFHKEAPLLSFVTPKVGRECVSAQRGVSKHSRVGWITAREVVGGESGEFRQVG